MPRISNRERLRREITTSLALSEPPLIKLGASARTRLQEAIDDDDETDMLLELLYVVETSRYTIPRNRRGLRSSQVPHYLKRLSIGQVPVKYSSIKACVLCYRRPATDDVCFESPVSKMKKASVVVHLMVAIKYFGCYGHGASRDALSRIVQPVHSRTVLRLQLLDLCRVHRQVSYGVCQRR
ncbi:hypothetical protein F444_19761 [Phytophthora nicotianae P1976]|uniref:Uncharacterized protein n=1 Tax=Phytophthora nicotianae P1976 TaxID=1317066 RepID=A0A080Z6P4_PHYNI|nr:hypothetical protein F444_19761 [Phytophthora nicotianae P1976]